MRSIDDSMNKMHKMIAQTGAELLVMMEISKLELKVESLFWNAKATLNNIWRLVDKAMEGRIILDMITEADLAQMNYEMSNIRSHLRPA